MLPDSRMERVRWAIDETIPILGIFLFWLAVAVVVDLVTSVLALPHWAISAEPFRSLAAFAGRFEFVWGAVAPLTTISAALYVLVRAGTLLIDHYRDTAGEWGSTRS